MNSRSYILVPAVSAKVFQVSYLSRVVVIDGLDMLKKENAGARDSIRFLESEFRKGNR